MTLMSKGRDYVKRQIQQMDRQLEVGRHMEKMCDKMDEIDEAERLLEESEANAAALADELGGHIEHTDRGDKPYLTTFVSHYPGRITDEDRSKIMEALGDLREAKARMMRLKGAGDDEVR